MKEKKLYIQDHVEEIAWRALMLDPKTIYSDWLHDLESVDDLIDLFDYLNDKLNSRFTHMVDVYKDDFMEKLKIEKLL
jgi:hypothetical protein